MWKLTSDEVQDLPVRSVLQARRFVPRFDISLGRQRIEEYFGRLGRGFNAGPQVSILVGKEGQELSLVVDDGQSDEFTLIPTTVDGVFGSTRALDRREIGLVCRESIRGVDGEVAIFRRFCRVFGNEEAVATAALFLLADSSEA